MKVELFADPSAVAARAAQWVAAQAREAVAARGRFTLALSGGQTPWRMLQLLAEEPLPWASVHLFQVDERVAPEGDPDRNLSHIRDCLLRLARDQGLPPGNVHAMPVNDADLPAAARRYGLELEAVAGKPPVLDVVHLGLGPDGHTASLVPGDPVLDVTDADVGLTRFYNGRVRMTLTYPVLDRARAVLWLVTGAEKAPVLPRLLAADRSIPAGRVHVEAAWVFADHAAAAALDN